MKNLAGLSSLIYDTNGARMLPILGDASALRAGGRRATRTATLDGECYVYDSGYAASDRTVKIETDAAYLPFLEYLVQTYAVIVLTLQDGAFYAVPMQYTGAGHKAVITLDITEQIA